MRESRHGGGAAARDAHVLVEGEGACGNAAPPLPPPAAPKLTKVLAAAPDRFVLDGQGMVALKQGK